MFIVRLIPFMVHDEYQIIPANSRKGSYPDIRKARRAATIMAATSSIGHDKPVYVREGDIITARYYHGVKTEKVATHL